MHHHTQLICSDLSSNVLPSWPQTMKPPHPAGIMQATTTFFVYWKKLSGEYSPLWFSVEWH
jgi:hypothetical protein